MNRFPNSLFRLLGGIIVLFLLSSCSTAWYMANSNYNNDPIYGVTEEGDSIKINVIDNYSDLRWKLRTDDKFRWDFKQYALNQDLSWYSSFYNRNFLYRYSPFYSSVDLYFDRFWYWDSWYWNYGYGWNTWHPFRWNNYSWYHPHYWNESYWFGHNRWRYRMNDYAWEHRDRRNVAYVNGRRGSNIVVTPNGSSRGGTNNIISNPNIRINRGRGNDVVLPRNYGGIAIKPNPNDVDVVIEKPNRNFIGRLFDKFEDAGVRVRTYTNPNNVPNNNRSRINNNNNNNVIRNYYTPPNNNNNFRSSSPPVRSYSPPPPSNISRGSSSGGAVISRGSSSRGKNGIN